MYCSKFDSVADLPGERFLNPVTPSICCVKSIKKLVVSSALPNAGVFARRGVGDGERDGEDRFRDVRGVGSAIVRGVWKSMSVLVGLCLSLAKVVMSGISEKVL